MGINPRIKPYWGKSQLSSNMVATSSGRVLAGPVLVLLSRLATAAPDSSNFQGKWSREGKKSEVTWKWREKELCVHGGNLKQSIFTLRHALNMPYASKESKGAIYLRFCSISYTSPFLFPGETGPWSTETWQVRLPLSQQKPWGSWAPRWVHRQHRRPRGVLSDEAGEVHTLLESTPAWPGLWTSSDKSKPKQSSHTQVTYKEENNIILCVGKVGHNEYRNKTF